MGVMFGVEPFAKHYPHPTAARRQSRQASVSFPHQGGREKGPPVLSKGVGAAPVPRDRIAFAMPE